MVEKKDIYIVPGTITFKNISKSRQTINKRVIATQTQGQSPFDLSEKKRQ